MIIYNFLVKVFHYHINSRNCFFRPFVTWIYAFQPKYNRFLYKLFIAFMQFAFFAYSRYWRKLIFFKINNTIDKFLKCLIMESFNNIGSSVFFNVDISYIKLLQI